ncbi:nucleolar protein dao-5-like, partial [Diaphorina citri]|uniref:Nucleolar protein dao-5-like n=1 Tax=Diaphorina citri TaxID=121845 RepID=A0A1S3D7E3_DIACI
MSRPTPHLIGSTDFFRDNTVGILEVSSQDQSEDEMPSPRTPSPPNEVPLESQNTEPSPTTTSLSYPQPHLYSPVETNSTPASFHDQLSAKLHSVAHNDPEITHRVIGKVGPPQLFASSGSTSEDESSSLFDSHTPPTSTSILPQPEPMLSTTSNIHVQQPSQSENIQNSIIIPKKVIDKDATASILNEMLSKKILANNSTKSDNAPNLSTKSSNEPTMSTTPKADSESTKSGPSGIFKDNDDVIHPKPPKQIQSSQKPFKSSLAKSLFESSSDEDEPIPNWIPNNSRNQGKLFDSDEDHVQENENPNNGDKVLPAKLPSSVTNNPNIEINVAPVLDKENRDTSEQDQIPTINKYKNNLTKVLPDISHAKPLRKHSLTDNTNKSLEDNNHTKEPEQLNKRDLEKSERKPMVKAKVKSIFDDSDDENVEEVKTAKTEPQETNVISKPVPKSIPNQPKKKIVSLFDDDSDDDIIEPSVPQKTIQTKPEVAKRSEDEVASREDKVRNSSVAVNNDDIFAEKHVASLNRTPSVPQKTIQTKPEVAKRSEDEVASREDKVTNSSVAVNNDDIFAEKHVASLDQDDLFAIPKKSTNHKTNMTDPTKSKLNSENVTNSNNDTSSNLFDETKIKANTLMSSIIENKIPGINNDSNEPVVKTPSNMSNESKSKAPEVITNLNAHKTPESLINSIEKSSTTNSSSDLFSEDTDNFESPEIITSLSVEHNVEVPLPPSKNNLDGSANKLPKENTSVRKEGNHLNNNSESESVNNQEIEKKPNVEKGGNELEKDIKAPRKSPNAKDELDLFKDDKKEPLGNRRIELFNSQDSDNSDDDLWGNVPKSKSLENSNNVKNTEYTHENTVSESISSMSDKALKVTDEKSTTDEALEIEDNKRETKVEVLNDKVSADHIECINNPITTEEHGSPNIGEIKKSLNLFGNIGSKAENIEEDKGKKKLPSHMKLNVNLAGLLPPGGAITKKTIDSLRRDGGAQEKEKTPDEKEILLPTPSESTDVSPQSDLTSPESSSSFLPSLTKGRAKIPTKRKPPTKKGSLKPSSGDANKNTLMTDSIDGINEKILTVNNDLQSNATNSQPKTSILNEENNSNKKAKEDSVTDSNISASNNVTKSTKEAVPATTNETASKIS